MAIVASIKKAHNALTVSDPRPRSPHRLQQAAQNAWNLFFPNWSNPIKLKALSIFYRSLDADWRTRLSAEEIARQEAFLEKWRIQEEFEDFQRSLKASPFRTRAMILKDLSTQSGKTAAWAYLLFLLLESPDERLDAQESLMGAGEETQTELLVFENEEEVFFLQNGMAYAVSPETSKVFRLADVKGQQWGRFASQPHRRYLLNLTTEEKFSLSMQLNSWVRSEQSPDLLIWSKSAVAAQGLAESYPIPILVQGGETSLDLYMKHLRLLNSESVAKVIHAQ